VAVPRGNYTGEITTSTTFAFGLVLGWSVGWGVLALVGSSIIADLVRRKPFRKVLFNAGQYALAIGAAGLVYTALGGTPKVQLSDLPPMIAAASVFFAVNTFLTAVAIGLTQGIGVREHLRRNLVFNIAVSGV